MQTGLANVCRMSVLAETVVSRRAEVAEPPAQPLVARISLVRPSDGVTFLFLCEWRNDRIADKEVIAVGPVHEVDL
jgi:hypothetical protein